jgi:TfoX/Sxy family transcriptional regulator of competence genes
VAFLLDGKMFVGVVKDDLMVRVGPERYEESLQDAHVRPMDFTGKPMLGYVYIARDGVEEETQLVKWVRLSTMFVTTLLEKKKRPTKKRTGVKRPK